MPEACRFGVASARQRRCRFSLFLLKETFVTFAYRPLLSPSRSRGLAAWLTLAGLVGLAACGDNAEGPEEPPPPAPAASRAIVVSGDFGATGVISLIDVAAGTIRPNLVRGAVGADPMIRRFGKELFVVNRFGPTGSSVTVFDAATLEVKHQLSTGTNSNPQDVAVIGDKLYLPATETKGVVALERNGVRSVIDLSSLDPDGKPDCTSIYAVGETLVVTCGLLDSFAPVRDAKVVLYDTVTNQMTSVALAARNPIGYLQPTPEESVYGGDLLVATADYGDHTKQCVVRIDPQTGANSCAISNAELGGIANHYEADAKAGLLYVTPTHYEGFSLVGALRTVDLATGKVAPQSWSPATQAISDLAVCPDGTIVGSDATFGESGVRLFATGAERTVAPLGIGLPPVPQNGIVCY